MLKRAHRPGRPAAADQPAAELGRHHQSVRAAAAAAFAQFRLQRRAGAATSTRCCSARTNANARKKMRKKERALAGYGEVRFERARGLHEVRRVLDAFFKQKSARMKAQGIPDVFAAPGVRRFIESGATEQAPAFRAADRALCAFGQRHDRRDHGRHRRRRTLLRHVQFDRARPLRHRKPGRATDPQSGARLLRARARHLRSRHRRRRNTRRCSAATSSRCSTATCR